MPTVSVPVADLLLVAPSTCEEALAQWDLGEQILTARVYAQSEPCAAECEQRAQECVLDVVRKVMKDGGLSPVLPLQMAKLAATTRMALWIQTFRTGHEWTDEEERAIRALAGSVLTMGWRDALRSIEQKDPGRLILVQKRQEAA